MNFYNSRSRQATECAGHYATVLQRNNLRRINTFHLRYAPRPYGKWVLPAWSFERQHLTAGRPRPEPHKCWTKLSQQVSGCLHARSSIATAAVGENFHGTGGSRPGFAGSLSFWQQWVTQNAQSVHHRVRYRLMRLFRLPAWGKLLMLVLVGLPIVILGASLLVRVTNMAWGEAAQMVFYVLQNVPGADITGFSQTSARLVLVLVHLLSLYTFAALVGLLTEDVRSTVEDIRRGNFPIPSRNHTVLLDGSRDASRLIGTLQRVLETQADQGASVYGGEVAVLSIHAKDTLDKMIADVMPEHCGRVVTRHGNPVKVSDLERVAAAHASTVLLLMPDRPMGRVGSALQQQLCLTALRSLHNQHPPTPQPPQQQGWRRRRQRVVVESGSSVMSVVTADSAVDAPLQVTYVSSTSSTSRVAVQCAVQPGLAAVYDAVFCRAGNASLRLIDLPSGMEGRTFVHARRRFPRAVVCGVLPGEDCSGGPGRGGSEGGGGNGGGGRGIVLSPPDGRVLERSDRLVLLAASREDCVPVLREVQAPKPPHHVTQFDAQHARPRRLVLLALDSCLTPAMLGALKEFGSRECSVTVISPEPLSAGLLSSPAVNGMSIRNQVGDPLSPGALLAADVAAADAVILTGTDDRPPDEADAVAIGVALLLKRLVTDPWVMSRGGSEEIAAVAAAVSSINPEDYWGGGRFAGDSVCSFDWSDLPALSGGEVQEEEESARRLRPPQPKASRPSLTFVCSLRDPRNRSVLQHIDIETCRTAEAAEIPGAPATGLVKRSRLSIEVLEPQALVSGMLAQVGAEPRLESALEDLLDEEGYEIYIKRCESYGLVPGSHVSWAQVTETVRGKGDVALGYLLRGQLQLAPAAEAELWLTSGDQLVVLAEDF